MRFTLVMMTIGLLTFVGHLQAAAPAESGRAELSFGIVPQQTPSKLLRSWGPVLKYLEGETGIRLRFQTAPDIPTFEQRLAEGWYDLAYMNPYHFTVMHEARLYNAVAHAKDKRIKGIVVVRKDSPIKSLEELLGTAMAFPAPAAFAATLLPQAHLSGRGIHIRPEYVQSHDSVYHSVASGRFVAGGGVMRTFNAVDPAIRDKLRILWTTPGYTPHAVAARQDVDPEAVRRIQAALAALGDGVDGQKYLQKLKIKGFSAADNSAWDDVRALNIKVSLGAAK